MPLKPPINEHEIDTVFHLGAQTIVGTALRSPLSTFESNIRGSYQLLEVCRRHKNMVKRIVVASSDKAYGTSPILPYTEEMPLVGKHPYDVSESCTDLLALSFHHTYALPVVIVRCGNIYRRRPTGAALFLARSEASLLDAPQKSAAMGHLAVITSMCKML